MSKLELLCRNATAFSADGEIDEDALWLSTSRSRDRWTCSCWAPPV